MRNPLAKSYLFARFAFTNFTWQFFGSGFQRKGHAMEPGKILDSSLLVLLTIAEIESTTRLEPAPPAGKAAARMPLGSHRRLKSNMIISPRHRSS
jgi:hypothetical protein